MRIRALLKVVLLGLCALVLVPGLATASTASLSSTAATRATAASGPAIEVSPLSHDFGVVDVGSTVSFDYTITNNGDQDLVVSALNLTCSGGGICDPGDTATLPPTVVPPFGGTATVTNTFAATMGIAWVASMEFLSNAPTGPFSVLVMGSGNTAPVLDPIGDKATAAFVPLNFTVSATDDNDQVGDLVTFSITGLPPGATFNTTTGAFSWTPVSADAGDYPLTFCASDGRLEDCESINIHVTAHNAPPVASAGGPYSAGPGQSIQFNGSGSSDPDGDVLTYAWNFGDGSPVVGGQNPTHSYALLGPYLATLVVTDDGDPNLSSVPSFANVQIISSIPATLAAKLTGSTMRITGGSSQLMGMELTDRPVTDLDAKTIKLATTYPDAGSVSEITPITKDPSVGDIDKDNVADLDVAFSRGDLALLLGKVPNNTVVTLVMSAHTTLGAGNLPVQGTMQVKIKGGASAVSAFASPNPFNPATSVMYSLQKGGDVSVRVYSLDGRLVKTLMEGPATAGTHEVLWDGRDNGGNSVRSGVYFVKTSSGGESAVFKVSLLK